MAHKQPQVTEQTRANLTAAFWGLYLVKPIEKITIREITDRAGYNRATFYLYFRDVYDLLEQLEEEVLGQVRALVENRLLRAETLDFSEHMGFIIELAQRFEGFMPHLIATDPTFGVRLKAIIAPLLDRFILSDERLEPREQNVLREYYLSGILGAMNAWMAEDDRMPIGRLIELIVAAAMPGASTHAGLSAHGGGEASSEASGA